MRAWAVRAALAAAVSVLFGASLAGQTIDAKPAALVFSVPACLKDSTPQSVAIANTGAGTLTWRVTGTPPAWLSISPVSGSAPSTIIIRPHTSGVRPGLYQFALTIDSNDSATPSLSVPVVLSLLNCADLGQGPDNPPVVPPPPPVSQLARYDVMFTFIGYSGLAEGAPHCKVNQQGTDVLRGTLVGYETPTPNEDVVYVGTLLRDTQMDFCETRGRRGPADDERVWCVVSLTGLTVTNVELTVSSDQGRGAYLEASHAIGPFRRKVGGDCQPPETRQVEVDYPTGDDGGGATPNGQQIDDTKAIDSKKRPISFSVGGLPRLRIGLYPPDSPKPGWTLTVIRKLP